MALMVTRGDNGAMRPAVVIIDDDADFRDVASIVLSRRGFDVADTAADAESGLVAVGRHQPDYVLLDVHLPDANGFDLIAPIRGHSRGVRVLLTSTDAALCDAVTRTDDVAFIAKDRIAERDLLTVFARRGSVVD